MTGRLAGAAIGAGTAAAAEAIVWAVVTRLGIKSAAVLAQAALDDMNSAAAAWTQAPDGKEFMVGYGLKFGPRLSSWERGLIAYDPDARVRRFSRWLCKAADAVERDGQRFKVPDGPVESPRKAIPDPRRDPDAWA